ncbi:MAG: hypothetical protein ACK4K2_08160 [Dehalococcoidia bacterium]
MLHTIFSAKFLAVVMAIALTATTVGIYAAGIQTTTVRQLGATGDTQVAGPVSSLTTAWTLQTSGSNAGKISTVDLSWTWSASVGNGPYTLDVRLFDSSTSGCGGTLTYLTGATTSVATTTTSASVSGNNTDPSLVDCTRIAFIHQ